ncbi:MAG: flavin reductase family protein [Acidimicrobiales bacterium]
MPVQQGIVGPVPEGREPEDYDRLRRRVLWSMPSGLYVIGSRAGERRNLMTANWVTQVSFDPKVLAVSVEREALTHELITAGGGFTVNLVDREDRALVRKFVKPAEADLEARTLNGFPFRDASTGAPVIQQALAWLDCTLRQSVDSGGHTVFLGEVIDAGVREEGAGAGGDLAVLRKEDTRMNYGG